MAKIYFVSDAHLGAETPEREERKERSLLSFFDHVQRDEAYRLYILGDLFDFWFEYRHVIPNRHHRVLFKLRQLVDSGLQVHYVTGNHDLWLGPFLETEMGVKLFRRPVELQSDLKRLYLAHGDGLSRKDTGYRILKGILQNPVNIALYRLLHPDLGIPIARWVSKKSRQHTSQKDYGDDSEYVEFACARFDEGFDIVLLAHTHRPMVVHAGDKCFMNLGAWMVSRTFAVLDQGRLELLQWDDEITRAMPCEAEQRVLPSNPKGVQ